MNRILISAPCRGFTLIELMILFAIIGVLTSVAIPRYRNYITKAKLTEAFYAITPVKYGLVEYVAVNGDTSGLAGKSWTTVLKEIGIKRGQTPLRDKCHKPSRTRKEQWKGFQCQSQTGASL